VETITSLVAPGGGVAIVGGVFEFTWGGPPPMLKTDAKDNYRSLSLYNFLSNRATFC
jgi:hypothetical protein